MTMRLPPRGFVAHMDYDGFIQSSDRVRQYFSATEPSASHGIGKTVRLS
ncbi:MAG: hypothetical protein ACI9BW_001411 [Gammaproteobacteria bacterium]|jgi:hypothetical protein